MPRLNHFAKRNDCDPLTHISEEHDRELVLRTIKATEGFVLFASIAMGILQMLSLKCTDDTMKKARYLRTPSKNGDSEATVMSYLRRNIFLMFLKHPDSFVTRFIRDKQLGESGTVGDNVA